MADVDGEQRASTMKQQKLPGVDNKSVSKIQADNAVSDFFARLPLLILQWIHIISEE